MKKVLIFSMLTVFMAGCMKERDAVCDPLPLDGPRIELHYPEDGKDKLKEQVKDVRVYIFDQDTKLLVDIADVSADQLKNGYADVTLQNGNYTFVAWGGSSADLLQSFETKEADGGADPGAYNVDVEIGVTTIDNFRMMLAAATLPAEEEGDITPFIDQFDDLFFAMADNVVVKNGVGQKINFDFIRNTHLLKVTVNGLQNLNKTRADVEPPLKIYVIGKNGIYSYNNSIDDYARDLRYEPSYDLIDENATTMVRNIKILRLELFKHTKSPVKLYVKNANTGKNIINPMNIIEKIFQNNIFKEQADLDRKYELPIEITIGPDSGIKIEIDGWEIIDLEPIIDEDEI